MKITIEYYLSKTIHTYGNVHSFYRLPKQSRLPTSTTRTSHTISFPISSIDNCIYNSCFLKSHTLCVSYSIIYQDLAFQWSQFRLLIIYTTLINQTLLLQHWKSLPWLLSSLIHGWRWLCSSGPSGKLQQDAAAHKRHRANHSNRLKLWNYWIQRRLRPTALGLRPMDSPSRGLSVLPFFSKITE